MLIKVCIIISEVLHIERKKSYLDNYSFDTVGSFN